MNDLLLALAAAALVYNTSPLPNGLAKQIASGVVLLLILVWAVLPALNLA